MEAILAFVFAAILVEAIVNIIENVDAKETSWKYWASLVGGIGLGVLVAVNWNVDLFKVAGFPDGQVPFVGAVLTGIIISRGSNYAADLVSKIGN